MTKATELTIRAQAAVKYPGWRVDFAGPATVVLTHIMGWRRVLNVRRRRKRCDGPWMRTAKWIVPAVILMGGMVVATWWIMALVMALGVRF